MSISPTQSSAGIQTVPLKSEEPKNQVKTSAPPKSSIASTLDELKLGERISDTSVKELFVGTFMGSIFGAGIALPSAGIAASLLPRNTNFAPVVFSGTIGAVAAGLTTDNPLNGAAVGAGTAATVGAVAGALIGGAKGALIMGVASAVGGAIGGSFSSITRGRMDAQPRSQSAGMGAVIMGMGRRR